jgi:hypothetical protein
LVRLERSTLPQHSGTRTIALRILKIVTPVKCVIPNYDGHVVQPEEGKLHRRVPLTTKAGFALDPQVWSVDIDKTKQRGLQLLWDA